MGAQSSSTNYADISNNIGVNYAASCDASQVVAVHNGTINVANTKCGTLKIDTVTMSSTQNCTFNTKISAIAKATADQTASSKADAGLPAAADYVSSDSSNVVDLQNNIEMAINTACGSQQTLTVDNAAIVLNGDLVDGICDLGNTTASQNSTCVMDLDMQLSASGQSAQTATSTAENTDPAVLLILLGVLLVGAVIFLGGGKAVWNAITAPARATAALAKKSSAAGAAVDAQIAAQRAKLQQLVAAKKSAASAPAPPGMPSMPPMPPGMPGAGYYYPPMPYYYPPPGMPPAPPGMPPMPPAPPAPPATPAAPMPPLPPTLSPLPV